MTQKTMKTEVIETGNGADVRLKGSRVCIRKYRNGKYSFFRLTWKVGNKPFQRSFTDKAKALAEAERIVRELARANGEQTTLSTAEIIFVREAMRKLRPYSLADAVKFFLEFHSVKTSSKSLGEVCDEFAKHITAKQETHGLSKRYVESIKYQTDVWKKWAGKKPISEMTKARIEELFGYSELSNTTKNNLLGTYRSLENFAKKRGFLPYDYRSLCDDFSLPRKIGMPLVFTPEELIRLFIVMEKHEIPYVATMAFGGPRRAEVERMTGKHLYFDEGQARIDETIAKTKSRRTFDRRPNLQEWLDLVKTPEDKFLITKRQVARISGDKARLKTVGLEWKDNGLRHSFCSYHLAKFRDLAQTSLLAGNSPEIITKNYNAVVASKAADEWFNITPSIVRAYAEKENLTHLITW